MRITPEDLLAFSRCPYLYTSGGAGKLVPPLTSVENMLRQSILAAEQRAINQESYVTSKKIGQIWESLWWPYAIKNNISVIDTEKTSVYISRKIIDYCKYDISGPGFETVGIEVKVDLNLNNCVIPVEIDMLKMPLFEDTDKIYLIDLTRKKVTKQQLANDIAIATKVYAFKSLKRPIIYLSADLSETNEKITTNASFFDLPEIEKTGKILRYLADGIYNGIDYQCTWQCENCHLC
jgi:hypothetical protein